MSSLNLVKLSPAQEKMWSDTRAAMLWHAPAFAHIFYTMLQNGKQTGSNGEPYGAVIVDNPEIPVAGTDGSNLILNATETGFFQFSLNERVFILVHEIMHCILNHAVLGHMFKMRGKVSFPDGKTLDYDHRTMNKAEDYVINAILQEAKIGKMPQHKDGTQAGLLDLAVATHKDASLDIYKKIYKKPPPMDNFDTLLPPGTSTGNSPTQAANERNQAAWATEVQSGMAAAKAMGKLPANIERIFQEFLEPQVDWTEHIRGIFARKVGGGQFDWAKPDRRLITREIYAPGRTGFGAGAVVVAVDTSGSIGAKELDMFMAEMAGILEDVNPEKLFIVWCDAKVHRVDECEDSGDLVAVRCKGAPGGGGTSFIPVFEEVDKLGITPEVLVYLTDGLGSFPNVAPSYPVIWGSIYKDAKYPWGDVVDIPKQA